MKGGQIKSLVDTGLSQLAASRDASPHGIDQRRGVELSFKAESMNFTHILFLYKRCTIYRCEMLTLLRRLGVARRARELSRVMLHRSSFNVHGRERG